MEQREVMWPNGISADRFAGNQVHIWRISLKVCLLSYPSLVSSLSADELDRANRLHFAEDRERFIIARATLRRLLGHYLHLNPREISFAYTPKGKPILMNGAVQHKLRFNLSHAGSLAICAVTWGRELGVDIEYINRDIALEAMVNQYCSPGEIRRMRQTSTEARKHQFFNYWVRKEAFLKAVGTGLAVSPGYIDVSPQQGGEWSLVEVPDAISKGSVWFGKDLVTTSGYTAAIVVEHEPGMLQYFELTDIDN